MVHAPRQRKFSLTNLCDVCIFTAQGSSQRDASLNRVHCHHPFARSCVVMHSLFYKNTWYASGYLYILSLAGLRLLCAGNRASGVMDARAASGIHHRHHGKASRASLEERVVDRIAALRASPRFRPQFLFQGDHNRIWESTPPTRNATTHVPVHTIDASFRPRSFNMTINEAMQGVNRVIVTRATTTWSLDK